MTINDLADRKTFDAATIANALAFVNLGRGRYAAPDEVGEGYWPTIRLSWAIKPCPVEIEILPDRFEFYQFFDGRTAIREFRPSGGQVVAPDLIDLLDPLLST